jgi:hypothetical protein
MMVGQGARKIGCRIKFFSSSMALYVASQVATLREKQSSF